MMGYLSFVLLYNSGKSDSSFNGMICSRVQNIHDVSVQDSF